MLSTATVARWIRIPLVGIIAAFAAIGLVASYRAYFPISSVRIHLAESPLRPGDGIRVDSVTSGRGPVSIKVELWQGAHSATVVLDRVASRRWAFWNVRPVRHSTFAAPSKAVLDGFASGPVVVRATVVGASAWLRQPPPVVEEVTTELRVEPETAQQGRNVP